MKAVFIKRDPVRQAAIADLLAGTNSVEEIATRLGSKPKSVYELCGRFERDAGVRFDWPWRTRPHPGRRAAPLAAAVAASN